MKSPKQSCPRKKERTSEINEGEFLSTNKAGISIAFAALIGLVLLRKVWHLFLKGIFELGRAAVTPTPDHKSIRVREHREGESTS